MPVVTSCGLPVPSRTGVAPPSGEVGGLRVLDWAGLKGAVSYTFDDANRSQIDHYAELQSLGVPLTFYLQTNKSDAKDAIWAQALLDGHELGNHSKSHPQTADADDVDAATAFIEENFGIKPLTMAAPYGDSSYVSVAETRFLINRGVSNSSVAAGSGNRFNLPCHIPAEGAAASAMDSVVDKAYQAGRWQIMLVHGFTGGSDGAYQPVSIEEFVAHVQHEKTQPDLWIDSVIDVGAYWVAQSIIADATPEVDGDSTNWTWTLPEHFPPGQCLRVAVDGGTLVQRGTALEWDEHGYYEVALDEGSLTLAP
jgi:peptidoglycan/xylan/chitin deacetylase (PgdA/CDA1 family)